MGLMQMLAAEPEHPLSSSSTAPSGARTPKPLGRAGAAGFAGGKPLCVALPQAICQPEHSSLHWCQAEPSIQRAEAQGSQAHKSEP